MRHKSQHCNYRVVSPGNQLPILRLFRSPFQQLAYRKMFAISEILRVSCAVGQKMGRRGNSYFLS
jgi:hypothetical protein